MMEYVVRKELGGYYPKNQHKQYFFNCLYNATIIKQKREREMARLRRLAKGGRS